MADIFISYSSKDRALAAALAADLEARGYSVWWDFELVGGHGFREQIHEQLNAARAVVVIWTKDSVMSEFVRDEADEAKRLKKLIPVRVPNLEMHEVPLGHRQSQTYLLADRERVDAAVAKLGPLGAAPPNLTSGSDTISDVLLYSDKTTLVTSNMIIARGQAYPISAIAQLKIEYNISVKAWFVMAFLSSLEILVLIRSGPFPKNLEDLLWVAGVVIAWVWLLVPSKKYKLIARLTTGRSIRLLDEVTAQAAEAISNAFSHAKISSLQR